MPAVAYLLAAFFVLLSILAGLAAWWLVGPRRLWAALLPIVTAFAALYQLGHRLGWQVGPMVDVAGFRLALPFDVALAVGVAFATALLQRSVAAFLDRAGAT
jgi:hypothetical protein